MDKWLTITVPAYNAQKYLYRCLHSVAQCGTYLEKIQVLVVNDGSTDCTEKIAEQFVREHPESFSLIRKENGGHGSALNRGIQEAQGRYFLVLDADDWLDGRALEELVKTIGGMAENMPDLISCHYSRVDMVTGSSTPVRQERVAYHKTYSFEELPVSDIYFALASICYRTKLLQSIGLKMQEHTFYADVEYMLLPMPYVEDVYFLDLYLYKYFVGNTQQSIYLPTMARRYEDHNRVMHRVIDTLVAGQSNGSTDTGCRKEPKGLSDAKKAYLWNILEKLLYTHYALALIYDKNHARGARRAKEFDAYLKHASFALYRRMNRSVPFLRVYRKYHFSVDKVRRAYGYQCYLKCLDKCRSICAKACWLWNRGKQARKKKQEVGKHV